MREDKREAIENHEWYFVNSWVLDFYSARDPRDKKIPIYSHIRDLVLKLVH